MAEQTTHQSENINELAAALAAAQAEIENPTKDRENPHFRTKYADLASVLNACRKPLAKNGLAVVQSGGGTYQAPTLRTTLIHKSGQWIAGEVPLVGDLSKPQSLGSLITYMRRYSLGAIAGVAQEDDDAEGATSHAPQNGSQRGNGNGSYQSSPPRQQADRDRQQGRDEVNRQFSPAPSNGGGNGRSTPFPECGDPGRMPRDGRGMFAWSKGKEEKENYPGVLKAVSAIGKELGLNDRMVQWSEQDVSAVWDRIMGAIGGGQPEPAGATIARDYVGGEDDGEVPF